MLRSIPFVLVPMMLLIGGSAVGQDCEEGWCGDPNACENCEFEGWSCDHSCREWGGTWTTCGAYYGAPPNDLDRDGISNASDNCRCIANGSQTDCDSDGRGDSCDSVDNSWRLVSTPSGICHIDIDDQFFFDIVEMWKEEIYHSTCSGTCVKKKLDRQYTCFPDISESCCQRKGYSAQQCSPGRWDQDVCGRPLCSF